MFESKFKTLRHIETVRNYLNVFVRDILERGELHDQSKLQEPEVTIFDEYTAKLRTCEYGSEEYKQFLAEMKPALDHHYAKNRHHPEHFNSISEMNLIDLIELFADWYAASLRHNSGNIRKSIEINKKRFNISDDLYQILLNTVDHFDNKNVRHHANES